MVLFNENQVDIDTILFFFAGLSLRFIIEQENYLDNLLGERLGDFLEEFHVDFSIGLDVEAVHDEFGQAVQIRGSHLYRQQDDHRQPVKHVVDGGATEGTSEFVTVAGLGHGDDGIGDGGADVGAHDNEDGGLHWQNC